jgi:hypothetical protein
MISSQALTINGLYVYLPAFSFSLPSCINEFDSFIHTFQRLISFQQHVIDTAYLFQQATSKKQSLDKSFGKHDKCTDGADSVLEWRRDTFYIPPRNKEAKLPL